MKPHSLNLLTTGPPLLYWRGTDRWCSGPCVLVLLSSALVFFHSHVILSLYLTTMHLAFLSLFIQPFWVFASFCYKYFIFLFLFLFLPSCLHNPQIWYNYFCWLTTSVPYIKEKGENLVADLGDLQ